MRLQVHHVTRYRYDQPMRSVVQSHRLHPASFEGQFVHGWETRVQGGAGEIGLRGGSFRDGAGDLIEAWTLAGPVSELVVTVSGEVETRDMAGVLRGHREIIPPTAYLRDTAATRVDVGLADLARSVSSEPGALALAHALSAAVSDRISYAPGTTTAQTTAAEALALGRGVCQDHAHALIAIARERGLPARYVSGYLQAEAAGQEQDAAHAWAEIWTEGLGWIGFDAANRCCPDARYIRLGSGLDAGLAAPIRGVARGAGSETMEVAVTVGEAAMHQAQQ